MRIGGGLSEIPVSAFSACTKLKAVYMSEGVTAIGAGAFDGCTALMACDIPDSLTKLGAGAFFDCSALDSYASYGGASYLGNTQNPYVALVKVTSGDTDFTMHPDTKCFAADAFAELGFESITIAEGVTVIPDGAFFGCLSLTEINLSSKTTEIGAHAFAFCQALESIDLPETLKIIGKSAFYGCAELGDVYYTDTEAKWREILIGEGNDYLKNATKHYNYLP